MGFNSGFKGLILSHHRPPSSLFFQGENLFMTWWSYLKLRWSIYICLSYNEMHVLSVCYFPFCVIGSGIVLCFEVCCIFAFIESWICLICFFSWQYAFKLLNFSKTFFFSQSKFKFCIQIMWHYKMPVLSFSLLLTIFHIIQKYFW